MKRKKIHFYHYNLLEYKKSMVQNFEMQVYIDNSKIWLLLF